MFVIAKILSELQEDREKCFHPEILNQFNLDGLLWIVDFKINTLTEHSNLLIKINK